MSLTLYGYLHKWQSEPGEHDFDHAAYSGPYISSLIDSLPRSVYNQSLPSETIEIIRKRLRTAIRSHRMQAEILSDATWVALREGQVMTLATWIIVFVQNSK